MIAARHVLRRPHDVYLLIGQSNVDVLDGMRAMLERVRCTVRTSPGAEGVPDMPAARTADIGIADHHLGTGATGRELLERLAVTHPSVRGILITADVSDETLRGGFARTRPILYKPVGVAELKRALHASGETRRAGAQVPLGGWAYPVRGPGRPRRSARAAAPRCA